MSVSPYESFVQATSLNNFTTQGHSWGLAQSEHEKINGGK